LITEKYSGMTASQKKIADYIRKNPEAPIRSSIVELASKIGVKSESSIVRFYRLLGFSGYHDFKVTIAQQIAGQAFYHSYEDIGSEDSPGLIKRKIFHGAILTLQANMEISNDNLFMKARDLILSSKRIIFLGYATSGVIAEYAFFRFVDMGFSCCYSADSHMNMAICAKLNEGDLLFCVSHSGETKDVISPIEFNRKNNINVPVIAVTGFENSRLGQLATVNIVTTSEETSYHTDAMNSRIVQMSIIDTLFTLVALYKGKDATDRLNMTRKALLVYKT